MKTDILIVVLCLLIGGILGWSYARDEVALAESNLKHVTEALQQQNEAIQLLQEEAKAREEAAEKAVTLARKETAIYRSKAVAVLSAQPVTQDLCTEARDNFDAELAEERAP